MCIYVHKICDDEFGSCKKSFSWLGQKVFKKINTYGHDAVNSGMDLCPWPQDDVASQQDISTPFSILIKFEATEYSIRIRNFEDIQFDIRFE